MGPPNPLSRDRTRREKGYLSSGKPGRRRKTRAPCRLPAGKILKKS
ncbi:hypothetical protein HMPREF3293_02653 [Christensenella minuta]|uniref:Uncharacterized protein n=1 Tax=Christensenella minuta TaxID=626937 RepID=A0A136Q1L2_9FIRM|nr:hypothetical protein HMPREF3293_02653 [Christensenella minuta]